MLELKFFKELPIRSLNENRAYASVVGADLYTDRDGNRYAFISFKNSYKTPLFSLYLHIKEYDSSGTFLKEDRFSIPTIYGTTGLHVINEPIPLENTCDGIEVFIYFAEYNRYNFYNDKFIKHGFEMTEPTSLTNAKTSAKMPGTSAAKLNKVPTAKQRPDGTIEYEDEEDEIIENVEYMETNVSAKAIKKASIFNFVGIACAVLAIIVFLVLFFMIPTTLQQVIYGIY